MRTRIALLLVSVLMLLPAAPALAQVGSNPFDNITPEPSVTPTPTADTSSTDETGRKTLYIIGAALVVAFAGIGIWIARDARRNLPKELREDRPRDQGPHRHERQAKAKARAKGRAQRQARKAGRKAKR
jgi:hypothetical protein